MSLRESAKKFERVEKNEKIEGLREFIESAAREIREKDNVPLREDGRIDMNAFSGIHPDTPEDLRRAKEWHEEWHPNVAEEEIARKRLLSDGEKLEMLAQAVFHKNIGNRFIVARASEYDDRVNGVDTILLDRETGNLVCAFDEVGDAGGAVYQEKQKNILEKNMNQGGAELKYGISLEKTGGSKSLKLGRVEHIPVFYIALPKNKIKEGVDSFIPDSSRQSDFEKKLFEFFIASIAAQIKGLELFTARLEHRGVKSKIDEFSKIIEGLRKTGGL